ncbi:transcriptional regulator, AraC family [Dyadobacter soli]|uniref:Transcriptional regulator, AraC family n=2 Tax=Dyadobacter soli TaxID=659014 RepID=A0A1G7XZA5_9BACT|nr:transcriptional regulator, AraC family [Dyadobacter soli]
MECEGEADWNQVRVLPDTCVELFVNYTTTPIAVIDQALYKRSIVCFRLSRPVDVQMRKGSGCLAVCFHPGMAYPFIRVPMDALKDTTVNFPDLWHDATSALEDELACAPDDEGRSAVMQDFLLRQLKSEKQDLQVAYCLNQAQHTQGSIPVRQLANETGLSQRQLSRRFHQSVGLSPKEYLGVCRFNASLRYLANYPGVSLTEIAHLSGYYDQAHFIRDYKVYTGHSPGEVVAASHILY